MNLGNQSWSKGFRNIRAVSRALWRWWILKIQLLNFSHDIPLYWCYKNLLGDYIVVVIGLIYLLSLARESVGFGILGAWPVSHSESKPCEE